MWDTKKTVFYVQETRIVEVKPSVSIGIDRIRMVGASSQLQSGLRIALLGSFDVQIDGRPMPRVRSRKERLLLALLVLRHGREVSRDWLAETLWPDSRIDQSLAYLRQTLCFLKSSLGSQAGRLQATPHWLRLEIQGADVDVAAFDAAIARGDDASLKKAVTLYTGPFLEGCTETWVENEQRLRENSWLLALEKVADLERRNGRIREACGLLDRLIQHDPLRESAHRSLMQLLADCGDYAAMTTAYRDLRILLRREANTDPSPESIAIYEQLRSQSKLRVEPVRRWASGPGVAYTPGSADEINAETFERKLPVTDSFPPESASGVLLPSPLTPLIGRKEVVQKIIDGLNEKRLTTLTGTGGVGKTRLALQAAKQWSSQGDVWFVELASLANPALLAQAVATVVGLTEAPGRSLDSALARYFADHPGLLVLDNCEHLLDSAEGFIRQILQACPDLRILATSRQALGMSGEALFPVPTMEIPPFTNTPTRVDEVGWLSELQRFEAIQLFLGRAQAVMPTFGLTAQNASAVLDICAALDGIPLAIELAAAWACVLTPEQMLASLTARRFDLLISRQRDPAARHRSLWATLDASCQLLEPPLLSFLARASAFRGGWTLEAAEAVCVPAVHSTASPALPKRALEYLAVLYERSLIQTHSSGSSMRYSLLETVREYASELLTQEDQEGVAQAHTAWCLALAELSAPHVIGPQQVQWLDRLEEEQNNMRAALSWCAQKPDRTETGLRLCTALWRFWDVRGHHQEGIEWISAFQSKDQTACAALRGHIREALGLLHAGFQDPEQSRKSSLAALEIYTEIGDDIGVARTLCTLGICETNLNHAEAARIRFQVCLPILEKSDNPYEYARALSGLGCLEQFLRAFDTARPILQQAADNYRVCGHLRGVALTVYRLGGIAMVNNQFDSAHELFVEALAITREVKDKMTLPFGLFHIGRNSLLLQDFSRARAYLNEAIECSRACRNNVVEGTCMVLLGDMALLEQDIPAACRYYFDALIPFDRPTRAAATSLVGSRLVAPALEQNRVADAIRLTAYAARHLTPRRTTEAPTAFLLYMSLGYLYLDLDRLESDIATMVALIADEFESIWNEAQTLTQRDGINYVRKMALELSASEV